MSRLFAAAAAGEGIHSPALRSWVVAVLVAGLLAVLSLHGYSVCAETLDATVTHSIMPRVSTPDGPNPLTKEDPAFTGPAPMSSTAAPASPGCVEAPTGMVGWWPADGNAQDAVNTNHGVLGNGATFAPGKVGQAFSLDGVNDYVSLDAGSTGLPLGNSPRTVEAWVQTTMAGLGEIFSYGNTAQGQSFTFGIWGASLFVSGWGSPQYTVSANVNDGQFHHVAVTYDGTSASVYCDGRLLDTRGFVINTASGSGNIGTRISPAEFFGGLIDELAVYSLALSAAEIQAIYDAGSAGKCALPPQITGQPQHRNAYTGEDVSFSVLARGTPPLSYQWQFHGVDLAGATNATLVLSNVQLSQEGKYAVVVTNAAGSVTSFSVTLTVSMPLPEALDTDGLVWSTGGSAPWLGQTNGTHDGIAAAQSGAITDSQQSVLQTTVIGPGILTFWWKVSSETNADSLRFYLGALLLTNISGEVDWQPQTFDISAGTKLLRWSYVKNASGSGGQDAGWVDEVSFTPTGPPVIRVQPTNQTVTAGSNVALNVVALGALPLSYQWQYNGSLMAGQTNATLVLSNVQLTQAGNYSVVISNVSGSVTSSTVALTVLERMETIHFPEFTSSAGLLFQGTTTLVSKWLRLNGSSAPGVGGAWLASKRLVARGFETTFQFRISNLVGGGADGFAFMIVGAPTPGMGGSGGGLGYNGLTNSVAVEFDTWQNQDRSDPNANHISVHSRGVNANTSDESASLGVTTAIPNLSDGAAHTVKVDYVPGTLRVFLDNLTNAILTVSVNLGTYLYLEEGCAWIGMVASTGLAYENHDILSWSFSAPEYIPMPPLSIRSMLGQGAIELTWPQAAPGFELEATANLSAPTWSPTNFTVLNSNVANGLTRVTVGLSGGGRFFRLKHRW